KLGFDQIIPGHGEVAPKGQLAFFRGYFVDLIAAVQKASADGATLDEMKTKVGDQLATKYEAGFSKYPLGRYRDRVGTNVEDVYQLHRFGHLEEYEAEWGRRWGANGIGRLRDVALSRPTEYEVLDLWLKHPKFFLLRYSSKIDLDALVRNHEAYEALLRSLGI